MGGYNFERLKFLVADDNAHMRKLVGAIINALGATNIVEAADGEQAWKLFCATRVDIVIIDWQMENTSGIDIVRRIRNAPDTPDPFVPIIMLTGHSQAEHVRLARDCGANEFMTKPITVKGLMAKLVSLVESPRPFIRTQTYFGPCRRRHSVAYHGADRRTSDEDEHKSSPATPDKTDKGK
jgi:two-component system, chemotaxis family, chemotaxis protein CheY